MVKKVIAGIVLVLLISFALVQAMDKEKEDKLPGLKVGVKAPDFTLKNLEGEKVQLSDFKGKKVLINFWATWCKPCRDEMPAMEKYYQSASNDVVFLAVNTDPTSDVKGFADEMKLTFPILLDNADKTMNAYGVLSIPTTFFIDEKGNIGSKHVGQMSYEEIKKYIEEL